MRALLGEATLFGEIQDTGLACGTTYHGKDADETLYASLRLDVELPIADGACALL